MRERRVVVGEVQNVAVVIDGGPAPRPDEKSVETALPGGVDGPLSSFGELSGWNVEAVHLPASITLALPDR